MSKLPPSFPGDTELLTPRERGVRDAIRQAMNQEATNVSIPAEDADRLMDQVILLRRDNAFRNEKIATQEAQITELKALVVHMAKMIGGEL